MATKTAADRAGSARSVCGEEGSLGAGIGRGQWRERNGAIQKMQWWLPLAYALVRPVILGVALVRSTREAWCNSARVPLAQKVDIRCNRNGAC